MHIMYCDGSSSPHLKKPAGYGYVIFNASEDEKVAFDTGEVPVEEGITNNVAEYYSLIKGLERAIDEGLMSLSIRMDSQLIVYQVSGKYKTKDATLQRLRARVHELLHRLDTFTVEWVRRKFNRADELSRVESP